jgi:putative transposase
VETFNGRIRDEFLNETLFFDLDDALSKVAVWVRRLRRHTDQLRQSPVAPPGPQGVNGPETLTAAG